MRGREPQGDDDSDRLDEGHAHPHLGRRQEVDARRTEEGDGPGAALLHKLQPEGRVDLLLLGQGNRPHLRPSGLQGGNHSVTFFPGLLRFLACTVAPAKVYASTDLSEED